jgi:hypothetical protein
MPSSSRSQQRLLGWAYACSQGKTENCPEWVMNIASSFMKKGKRKGKKNLRDFAKTKHDGLPERISLEEAPKRRTRKKASKKGRKKAKTKNESLITRFDQFIIEHYETSSKMD